MAKTSIGGEGEKGLGKPLAVLVVIVLIAVGAYLLLSQPGEVGPVTPVTDNSKQILNQALAATSAATRQTFDMSGYIQATSRVQDIKVPFAGEGAQDIDAQEMYFKTEISIPEIGFFEGGSQIIETYMIGNEIYTSAGADWVKVVSEEDIWAEDGQLVGPGQVVNLLNDMGSELIGSAVVDGKDTYEIRIIPNIEMMIQQLQTIQPPGLEPLEPLSAAGIQEVKDAVEDMSAKVWVDKASNLPVKVELKIDFVFKNIDVELGRVADLDVSLYFLINNDFESPVTITLPAAAQAAEEVTTEGF